VVSIQAGKCELTWGFLILWGVGEILNLIYVWEKNKGQQILPLLAMNFINIIMIVWLGALK
jgi:hypothetical protein